MAAHGNAPLPPRKPAGSAGSASAAAPVTILVIGCGPLIDEIRCILGHSRWRVLGCQNLAQANDLVPTLGPAVLVTEATLADGAWQDILRQVGRLPVPPPVVVAASDADDALWMEVLNQGGYNLLGKPLDEQEVFRILSTAWLRQWHERETRRIAAV
jgi:FixJ family two-component response regulator